MPELVFNIYKESGVTPLECINNLKKDHPELRLLPMTYAGRLDPLAQGVLLILAGEECKQKEKYLNLPKEYEVDVLFGFSTDTYDVMGLINKYTESTEKLFDFPRSGSSSSLIRGPEKLNNFGVLDNKNCSSSDFVLLVEKIITQFIGKIKQAYPPYSSRPVKGQPLFKWARDGRLDEIEIPSHDVFVENIEIIGQNEISGQSLLLKIKEDIGKVKGDFRQEEIISLWKTELKNKDEEKFNVIKLRISCGSGVYVRALAHEIGENLGIPALALNIKRTKVGEYGIEK